MFTSQQQTQMAAMGISQDEVSKQLEDFRRGFPFLRLKGTASVGQGIWRYDAEDIAYMTELWQRALETGQLRVTKFVPASGAASRMFKDLFSFADADYDQPTTDFECTFFDALPRFAFYDTLSLSCQQRFGKTVEGLIAAKRYKDIVHTLLDTDGMNYGQLPKGLLEFHTYAENSRTPFEEHLAEGADYAKDKHNNVHIHYTVSAEHETLFKAKVQEKAAALEEKLGVRYSINFSQQKKSTDTIAVNEDNTPFTNEDGSLLFRPGGHGALIENLNDLDTDIVFIKNIDNVVPDRLKENCNTYKRLLGGVLIHYRQQIFDYLQQLEADTYTEEDLEAIAIFLRQELSCEEPDGQVLYGKELADYLYKKLHRPLRVCGMVKNIGEPGGGPFLAYNNDGTASLQILESSQIDMKNAAMKAMFEQGTHFNPVDLVCSITDHKGNAFDLRRFVDKATGFISSKSKGGRTLKALELPGLWNGAMSDWNTIFVEVPLSTFNPVKTVNDLLRPEHQSI